MSNASDTSAPDRSPCGAKFRAMLKCVEKTGASAACTETINDFLACERLVFRTALAKQPASTPTSDTSTRKTRHHTRTPSQSEHVTSPRLFFSRIVDKQLAACTSLTDSLRRPQFSIAFASFANRMVLDIRLSCDALCTKAGSVCTHVFNRISSVRKGDRPDT